MAADAPPRTSLVYTWEPSNAAMARRYGLRPDQILRFDTNTSPLPPAELIAARLAAPFDPTLNEYPDSSYEELTEAIAAYAGVAADRIVVGAGADEILDLVAKALLPAGGTALIPTPTYGMYGVLTAQRAARVLTVPRLGWDAAFGLDVPAIVAALPGVEVVWLCSPNNPTGTFDAEDVIRAVLDAARTHAQPPAIVVDEAYFEFVDRSMATAIEAYPHLVVVRTVSKAFALAGVRVGYAIAARPTIERLERVRPPGSISTISAALATAALREPDLARANVAGLIFERDWLAARLRETGRSVQSSVTNFLLVHIGGASAAAETTERLQRSGIVPRTFDDDHPLAGHLRLTVRTRAENERLLEALA